ncbi:hypothetical protein DXG01_007170 [Tephrocybe rancida]|nr:hypothetical protein DXG01_007170 [Tephrocybe rancida]
MPVPPRVVQWVDENYKKPRVDPQWLNECYTWLTTDGNHNPDTGFQALVDQIKYQLLESSLADSMLPGTGLPTHVAHTDTKKVLTGQEIYVEIAAITEIGSSAFSLDQTRIAREERKKEGNIDDDEGEGDIDIAGEGPMPKYSRGMLRFELTDGTTAVPAIEYRSLPDLSLENTPLGFKVLLLKDVRVHKGILWLEPKTVVLLGHKTDEREDHREANFAQGLRARMRLSEPAPANNAVARPNPPVARQPSAPPPLTVRSPLREISPPPLPPAMYHGNDDEDLETRRRRIPARNPDPPAPSRSTAPSSSNRTIATTSSYFANTNTSGSHTLVGSPTSGFSLSPTIRQTRPNLPPAPPSPCPEDEHFWSEDENENMRRSPSPGKRKFVVDFGAVAVRFLAELSEKRAAAAQSSGSIVHQTRSQTKQKASTNVASPDKGKGKCVEVAVSSDEYDNDDMVDAGMIAELDAIEKGWIDPPNPQPASTEGSGSSGLRTGTGGSSVDNNVIEIDSDEDDKENAPVPTRHVRRRVGPSQKQGLFGGSQARKAMPADVEILELSDSD